MTNEQRQDNIDARLERLLASSEQANARLDRMEARSEANQRQIDANTAAIAELRSAVSSLVQVASQHQQNFEVIVGEIKGLRTESQRILEHLFGRQDS